MIDFMFDGAKRQDSENERARSETAVSDSATASEPFACPHCGQMLAPGVRVCVVCKRAIDPAEIRRPKPDAAAAAPYPTLSPPARSRFSWQIFLVVLIAWLLAAVFTQQFWGPGVSQLAMGGIVVISSAWVFFDAQQRGVPQPLRWGLGSLLLWIVVFPWYLARRRTPKAPCPFVEAKVSPLSRALLFALMVFFLLSAVIFLLKGPK